MWFDDAERKAEEYRIAGQQLLEAATHGDLAVCQNLLKNGASLTERTGAGETAMLIVARMGRIEICRELVAAGCNVNCVDSLGRTPVELASRSGFTDLAKFLIDSGGFGSYLPGEAEQVSRSGAEVAPWPIVRPQSAPSGPGEELNSDLHPGSNAKFMPTAAFQSRPYSAPVLVYDIHSPFHVYTGP